jgi:hypothetical protein
VDRETIFESWAPRDGVWTPWVKPVLFAYIEETPKEAFPLPRPTWIRSELLEVGESVATYRDGVRGAAVAIVVDLPGAEGLAVGLELAHLGLRPVPLYTALPDPAALVPMDELLRGLAAGREALDAIGLPPVAPPAFLLDSRRFAEGRNAGPGEFDNRTVAFPTDFPSAEKLRAKGVEAMIVIQSGQSEPRADVVETLRGWQREGLTLFLLRADAPAPPAPLDLRGVGVLRRLQLWWRRSTLRGDDRDGFGELVPIRRHVG